MPIKSILLLALLATTAAAAPRITEFLASNTTGGLADQDGEFPDWIEIHNNSASPVDLSGHFLTDDATALTKWPFPAVTLPAQAYLVVFASGKNRTDPAVPLHTNFRLAAGGEYLALTTSGGSVILTEFTPAFPGQDTGVSYGLGSDGTTVGYFATPTPGTPNGTASLGSVADTNFSHDRGFYTAPFDLAITSDTPGASIRYTTDGSTPSPTAGTLYDGTPVTIAATTTLRAIAYKDGFEPTDVDTHTYLFLEDVRTQYADRRPPPNWPSRSPTSQLLDYGMDLRISTEAAAPDMIAALSAIPSMSVVTDQDNITGSTRRGSSVDGFYVFPQQHGIDWERPASLELIYPDGTKGFQENCGVRVRGGFSRSESNPKHALRFFFRDQYGAGKLNYPLFGNEGATEFDKFDLRTSQNYSWAFQGDSQNTFLREVLGRDLQGSMGKPYTRSRYYHLYLNGVYWGLYMTQERAEASYGETYFGGDQDDYDTIKSAGSSGGYNTEATDGELNGDWRDLWTLGRQQAASPTLERYLQMQGLNPDGTRNPAFPVLLDVENLIDYTLLIAYTGNYDAPLSNFLGGASNNWYGVRNRVSDDRGFAFFVHDGEHSMGAGGNWNSANDRLNTSNGRNQVNQFQKSNPGFLHWDLSTTDEYKIAFADRVYKHFYNGGVLTPEQVTAHIERREPTVASVILAESARWGDAKGGPFTTRHWEAAVSFLKTRIVPTRTRVVLSHVSRARLWPSIDPPTFSQHGGTVSPGAKINLSTDAGTIYLTTDGSDPRLLGGAINPAATQLDANTGVTIDTPITLRARTLAAGEWSALTEAHFTTGVPATAANLRISELHYHPAEPTSQNEIDVSADRDDYEFVELLNISAETIDLGGVAFVQKQVGDHLEGIRFTFPAGTLLPPGHYATVVADTAAFSVRYPATPIAGDYAGRLGNTGEWVTLQAADGSLIASFRYNDIAPWPVEADGSGRSLVFSNPASPDPDYAAPSNWSASPADGGSPGSSGGRTFVGDPVADNDNDTIPALVEYYQGTSDNDPLDVFSPAVTAVRAGDNGIVTFTVQRDPAISDASIRFEVSQDLKTWNDATISTVLDGTTPLPSGLVLDTYHITFSNDNALRIRIVLTP